MSFHTIFCEERRELHEAREGNNARAAYAALPELQRTERLPERTRADFADERRDGVCICCGASAQIRRMMHVCDACHDGLEEERV